MNINPQKKRCQPASSDDGFTLIEVLAGIIMATVFVLITSQAIAISAVYRIRAQRQSEALLIVQQDLEDLKFEALQSFAGVTADCAPTNTIDGYAGGLARKVRESTDPAFAAWPYTTNRVVQILGKDYNLTRTFDVNAAPFHVMTVSYSVTDPSAPASINSLNTELADFYTEVIPDAAFSCD